MQTIQDNINKENIPENFKKKNFILSKVKSNRDFKSNMSNKSVNDNSENKIDALRKIKVYFYLYSQLKIILDKILLE